MEIRKMYMELRSKYNKQQKLPYIIAVIGGLVGFIIGFTVPVAIYSVNASS
jgi:ABC-type nickel/cobalt efflux system permease component RcnA